MSAFHRNLDAMRVPRPGTKLRAFYDALLSGELVVAGWFFPAKGTAGPCIAQLREFYGCEIISKSGYGGGCVMLGRWDGPYFVPVERLDTYATAA